MSDVPPHRPEPRRVSRVACRRLAVLAIAPLVMGCPSFKPAPWAGEGLVRGWSVLPGRLLAAPEAVMEPDPAPAETLVARVTATAVDAGLPGDREPMIDVAGTLIGLDEARPVNAVADQLEQAAVLPESTYQAWLADGRPVVLAEEDGVVPPSGTFVFWLRGEEGAGRRRVLPMIEVRLHSADEGVAVMISVVGRPRGLADGELDDVLDDDPTVANAATPDLRRESVVLRSHLALDGPPVLVSVQPPYAAAERRAVLLSISVASPPPASSPGFARHEDLTHAAAFELQQVVSALMERRDPEGGADPHTREIRSAIRTLRQGAVSRAALLRLAALTDAAFAADAALLLDDAALRSITAEPFDRREVDRVGLDLESRAMRVAIEAALGGDANASALSLLAQHCGALMRYPSLLQTMVEDCRSLSDLRERIKRENLLFLEDRRVADRVRAYDWLTARSAAPAGFDPLASDEDRRAALADFEAKATKDARPAEDAVP